MSAHKRSNTHQTETQPYARVNRRPVYRYCPLKQVCISGVVRMVGECWQEVGKTQLITAVNNYSTPLRIARFSTKDVFL